MNENTSTAAPKTFEIIDGNTLMAQECEPLQSNNHAQGRGSRQKTIAAPLFFFCPR